MSAHDPRSRRDRTGLAAFWHRLRSRELTRTDRARLLAAVVSLSAGLVVFLTATRLFPYHSTNDDEAVYLLQAAMLLEGQFEIHADALAEAFRPWFFVDDGGRLYPKYNPVPAGMFAVSMGLFGEPRVTLAAVAAGNAALVYAIGSTAFDRRVGLVAAIAYAASPMALFASSVFLPYAPTTFFNLAFAYLYLRGVRRASLPSAAGAGVAIGLAFFARPYTAVWFALPFIAHALWSIAGASRREEFSLRRLATADPIRRNALTAAGGLAFVGLTLAYNARVTGSLLRFPYAAFAPLDGPGFGHRELLHHSVEYTLPLALESNGYVLRYLATRWLVAGPVGALAALVGLALAIRRWRAGGSRSSQADATGDRTASLLLAVTLLTVCLGNLAFWGNRNILSTPTDPTNGFISRFGAIYHYDVLPVLSVFAAVGTVAAWRSLRAGRLRARLETRLTPAAARRLALAALVTSLLLVGGVNAALLAGPLERHATSTAAFETAYEPFEERDVEDALVFLPPTYGDWLGHPFQALRNDPDLEGEVVYALDGDPARDVAVLEAYPDRTVYRYAYRGDWDPDDPDHVSPTLQRLDRREAVGFAGETTVGVPAVVESATVRLETDEGSTETTVDPGDPGSTLEVEWRLADGRAALAGVEANGTRSSLDDAVALEAAKEVRLSVTLVQRDGASLTYRQEATVRRTDAGLEVLWPPERSVCLLETTCGTDGTYLPSDPEHPIDGVSFETRLESLESSEA